MSLQERTLVVKNFDPEKTTSRLLKELCIQGGPVRNVIVKPDHAFVEYEDIESVGYSKALLDGVVLFGKKLILETKLREQRYFKYTKLLNDYIRYDKEQQLQRQQLQQQQAFQYQQQMAMLQQPPQQMLPSMGVQPGIHTPVFNTSIQMPQVVPPQYQQYPQMQQMGMSHSYSLGSIPQSFPTMGFSGSNLKPQISNINSCTQAPSINPFNVPSIPSSSRSNYSTNANGNRSNSNARRSRSFNNHQSNDYWEKRRR